MVNHPYNRNKVSLLTGPGRERLSSQQCEGKTHWVACYSLLPAWLKNDGLILHFSSPHQTAAYLDDIHPVDQSQSRGKSQIYIYIFVQIIPVRKPQRTMVHIAQEIIEKYLPFAGKESIL